MLRDLLAAIVCRISGIIMGWRYRVKVHGMDAVFDKPGPYLVLPNHPAYADPPNLIVNLWPRFHIRPLLLETNFNNPVLGPFGWVIRAIKMPDLEKASAETRGRIAEATNETVAALKNGDNVIIWPSGRLSRDGSEKLGGSRTVAELLAEVPNVTIVLVRTRGLWGSMFSWAQTGKKMNILTLLFRGFLIHLSNLFLFTPRRNVTLTLEAFTRDQHPEPKREILNPWLEQWYNADTPAEEPTYVPYHHFWGPREFDFPPPNAMSDVDFDKVTDETRTAVAEILGEKIKRPLDENEQSPETTLSALGLDSLDTMDVMLQIEQRFGHAGEIIPLTIGELWALASGQVKHSPPKPPPKQWFDKPTGDTTVHCEATTIPQAIVDRVLATPKDVATMDDIGGLLTYEQVFMRAMLLADRFRDYPEKSVGLLIPASSAGIVSLIALHLAGKLPVILNWTTGPGNMEHGVKLTELKRVITSKAFVDRIGVEVPGAEFVYLEEIGKTFGTFEKLRRLVALKMLRKRVAKNVLRKLDTKPDSPAVILFTSGSEKAPKAVPLTHENILSDIRGFIPRLKVDRYNNVLVFLPLFHSFGHTVTGLFTFIAGVHNLYHPDPTDAATLLRKAIDYKITAIATTPTFFQHIIDRAQPGDLDALQILVLGAEKCPQQLFDKVKKLAPNCNVMEGYGITECSPVVAVNPRGEEKHGSIGMPVKGIDVCTVDLETDQVQPTGQGKMGMLHIHGPIVFPGYLGHDGPQPFREFDGKKYYITGDLAEIDIDGYLIFHGRLKRFIKAGGEMISLPALEEPLSKKYPPNDNGPQVAVEGIETDSGRHVVLFTTQEMSLRDANAILTEAGFRGVMRLDDVKVVERIPQLGSGKTDYKVLRKQLEEKEQH